MDDQPRPMVHLPQAHEYVQLLSNFAIDHSLEISNVDMMNMQSFTDELNMISKSNIKKHYRMTIDSYLRIV